MTMSIPDQIRGFALRYEEQESRWEYYQKLTQDNGYRSITEVLVRADQLKVALEAVRAVLADFASDGFSRAECVDTIAKIDGVLR